jgi:soluble lytic murein transglycosylase-like protein
VSATRDDAPGTVGGALWLAFCILCAVLFAVAVAQEARGDTLPPQYRPAIERATSFYFGIPAPVPVIAAQIRQESDWNPSAKSYVGASGLMQFMPATAKWAAEAGGFGLAAPLDPEWAIQAGVWYDRFLYDRVKGASACDRWAFALSAYNGGLGRVYKRQSLSETPLLWEPTTLINPGISDSNQRENQGYPRAILFKWQPLFKSYGATVCKL